MDYNVFVKALKNSVIDNQWLFENDLSCSLKLESISFLLASICSIDLLCSASSSLKTLFKLFLLDFLEYHLSEGYLINLPLYFQMQTLIVQDVLKSPRLN